MSPKKPGRPFTGQAKSNAQRQAEYRSKVERERLAAIEVTAMAHSSTSDAKLIKLMQTAGPRVLQSLWIELGRRKRWH
jgi:hypothetical protein